MRGGSFVRYAYSSDPCTHRNDWMSIMSRGCRSWRSRRTVRAKASADAYVGHVGFDEYANGKPYASAARRVTVGLRKRWTRGRAMNPKTVVTGHVRTRVWRRGNPATARSHASNRSCLPPVP